MQKTGDRNVLLGLLALQHGFVDDEQWISAVKTWRSNQEQSLADILKDNGFLSEESCRTLNSLVDGYPKSISGDQPLHDAPLIPHSFDTLDHSADGNGLATVPYDRFSTHVGLRANETRPSSADTIIPITDAKKMGPPTTEREKEAQRLASGAALRFKILRPHAQGGLGKVSIARDQELNREVALKEIRFQYADDASARARFVMEAEVTGGLEHPSIVPVYGLGCFPDGRPYYAMRFIKGDSLKDVVDRFHGSNAADTNATNERSVELRRLLQRFIDVCQAIEYAHSRGVIHRDIKPANIMLGAYGETLVVDWGLAKPLGHKEVLPLREADPDAQAIQAFRPATGSSVEATRMGSTIGTLQFMGPEQAAGRVDLIGTPADIYSLGATLYYILTGRPSVNGKSKGELLKAIKSGNIASPRTIVSSIPKSLDAVCMKAMALNPHDRYPSAQALAIDLERWLADEPVSVFRESPSDRMSRWLRQNRAWFRTAALATIAVIVVLLVAVILINSQRNVADQQRQLAETLATEKSELAERETELRKKAQWQAADRSYDQSLLRCEQMDPGAGILSLVQNLAEAQALGASDLEYSIRAQLGRWEGALHTLESTTQYSDPIHELLQSPDGMTMLVATSGPTILLHLETEDLVGTPLTHDQRVTSMAYFSDGKRFVTASTDGVVRFWDANSAEPIGDPLIVDEGLVSISLSSDQRYLAIATGSKIRLWNAETREPLDIVFEQGGEISDIEFCPGHPLLLAGDWDDKVHVWDVNTMQRVGEPWEHGSPVLDVAISPDGKLAATCELNNVARIWEISRGQPIGLPFVHYGMVGHANFSPDSRRLITGCADRSTRVWDVTTGGLVGSPLRHPLIINAAMFDNSNDFIWTGCGDKSLRRWRIANGRSTTLPLDQVRNVLAAKLENDAASLQLLSAAIVTETFVMPGELSQWNVATQTLQETPIKSDRWRRVAAYSPDGRWFATATDGTSVQVWNSATGEPVGTAIQSSSLPKTLAFSPDAQTLLIGTETGEVQLREISSGKPLGNTRQWESGIVSAAFFPSGDRLIVGCMDRKARLFRINDPSDAEPIELVHDSIVMHVGVNPAGTRCFTSVSDGSIRLWDANTYERFGSVMNHESRTTNAIFTPDGGIILASYLDGSTRLWDASNSDAIGPPLRHAKEVTALARSEDGNWAVTASTDKTARVWNIGPIKGSHEEIQRRYELMTGMRQLSDGTLEVLTFDQWNQRKMSTTH